MTSSVIEATFIAGSRGRLFVLVRRPTGPCSRAVLLVPPFAEEMNKTRRLMTDLSHGLAARGVATVLPDLYGTGDSEGEFRDGDWVLWQEDLIEVFNWMNRGGLNVTGMLGVRLGCALGAAALARINARIRRTVFWQPVTDGSRHLTQFLRLRVAASMMEDQKETVASLRSQLQAGVAINVAGYEISPQLAKQIDGIVLAATLPTGLSELHWIEITRGDENGIPETSASVIRTVAPRLRAITPVVISGAPFWSATETVRNSQLTGLTADLLSEAA